MIALNDGTMIPQLGFGTLNVQPDRRPTPSNIAKTADIVGEALEVGYRHIDTAQIYGTEEGVGAAIAASGIRREELYVTSKLGNGNHHPGRRAPLVRRDARQPPPRLPRPLPDPLAAADALRRRLRLNLERMTELVADGGLRSAGVSSFHPDHLDRIISETGVVPVANQIESAPVLQE
jgi:2,5-diketo-D-gluconate reductase A